MDKKEDKIAHVVLRGSDLCGEDKASGSPII